MVYLLLFALANCFMASMLALLAWCTGKWVKSPAVLHLLWVLVLLRLVFPPVLLVDMTGAHGWMDRMAQRASENQTQIVYRAVQRSETLAALKRALNEPTVLPIRELVPPTSEDATTVADGGVTLLSAGQTIYRRSAVCMTWLLTWGQSILLPIWCIGTLVCMGIQLRSAWLFSRSVRRSAYKSRIWQKRVEKVALRMGFSSCPELYLMRANISPMLWGFGSGTRILFPEKLLENLGTVGQNTLLAHELAHYRRGDQWVRLVELVATALFWWHPVLWWARQEIERNEEKCCDAWAVRVTNGCPRTYAEALLSAVDFVSLSLPPVASGVSHSGFLRQRLMAIMGERQRGRRSLLPESYPGVIVLSVLFLVPCPEFWQPNTIANPLINRPTIAALSPQVKSPPGEPATPPRRVRPTLSVDVSQRASFHNPETGNRRDFPVGYVSSSRFAADGSVLVVGTMSGQVEVIDCESTETRARYEISHSAVGSVCISPDGETLATGTRDGLCSLLDLNNNGATILSMRRTGSQVNSVRFSRDGRFVAVLWQRRTTQLCEVWDLNSGKISGRLSLDGIGTEKCVAAIPAPNAANAELHPWYLIGSDGSTTHWNGDSALVALPELKFGPAEVRNLRIATTPSGPALKGSVPPR